MVTGISIARPIRMDAGISFAVVWIVAFWFVLSLDRFLQH